MNPSSPVEHYLAELGRGLRFYAGSRADVVDEVRDHLIEACERFRREGCSQDEAERRAQAAFGDPLELGRRFVAQHSRGRVRLLLPLALVLGLLMAFVDSRPTWDDTGVSAFAVLVVTCLFGLLDPSRPWLWALAIGLWFPVLSIYVNSNYGAFLALLVACIGAFGGSFARRLSSA